jgi:hypothetical protein
LFDWRRMYIFVFLGKRLERNYVCEFLKKWGERLFICFCLTFILKLEFFFVVWGEKLWFLFFGSFVFGMFVLLDESEVVLGLVQTFFFGWNAFLWRNFWKWFLYCQVKNLARGCFSVFWSIRRRLVGCRGFCGKGCEFLFCFDGSWNVRRICEMSVCRGFCVEIF